jgi:aminomethyltransferase
VADSQSRLLDTPLSRLHESLGARMVPFAGYAMPIQYPTGIIKEHTHTRSAAGLFDVSHMGQVRVSGETAPAALESMMPIDLEGLADGRQRYGFLTQDDGGIVDDLMVARLGDEFLIVINAARKSADLPLLRDGLAAFPQATMATLDERALLALQGPAAAAVLGRLAPSVANMRFMQVAMAELAGAPCHVSRSGYTGEDGFEISVPAEAAESLARELLRHDKVAPVGLGARDSLRLEAGLCLYGNDIDTSTSPVEANLTWALSKARRAGGSRPGGYPGAEVIMRQIESGTGRLRVGLRPSGRVPLRAGAELFDSDGRRAGTVTSGSFGPTLGAPVAMGYVVRSVAAPGTRLAAMVRDKTVAVEVVAMPIVPHHYRR